MNKKKVLVCFVIITFLINLVLGVNIDLDKEYTSQLISPEVVTHRSNPGIASETPAEIIFNVANNDFNFMIEGNLRCNPPNGVNVKSVIGASSGVGASYGTFADILPQSQTDITFTILSDQVFERRLMNCDLIYYYSTSKDGVKYYLGREKKFSQDKEELASFKISISSAISFNEKQKAKTDKVKLALYILGSLAAIFTGIKSLFSWRDWFTMYKEGQGIFRYMQRKNWIKKR